MKKTLFRQLLFYLFIFGIVLGGLSILIIEFFFDDYYYLQQEKLLVSHTKNLAKEYNRLGLEGISSLIDENYLDHGMSVHFFDQDNNILYVNGTKGSGKQGLSGTIKNYPTDSVFISTTGTQNNPRRWLSYLVYTDDGNRILAKISYTSMNSVVDLVQKFFMFFGIALIIIFTVFAYLFSRSMSRPLKDLNSIARRMGRLDFSQQYKGNRIDEIGMLGKTLNEITGKLENTISQLQGELSKEKTLEKMRTQFTAQVSHELQTPLSVIKGYSEALSDRIYSNNEASEVYAILLSETEKISNMVDDLLDLSQMESGAYVIRKKEFLLSHLVSKLFQRHQNLPSGEKYDMLYETDYPKDMEYSGDQVRLEQAIRNILVNAIKHVSKNGIIKISLAKNKEDITISIFNSGDPISEEDLLHIFDSYYQGKSHRGGTGLGLAISSHIIKLHNGTIYAKNTNDGVVFTISLPH